MMVHLHQGDALEFIRSLPDRSADSMVTDPPAGIGFMGKEWDKDKGGREHWIDWLTAIMTEARRVLKPGSHALVWALPENVTLDRARPGAGRLRASRQPPPRLRDGLPVVARHLEGHRPGSGSGAGGDWTESVQRSAR